MRYLSGTAVAIPGLVLLAGCASINPLAAIDGRYIPPEENAATQGAQPIDLAPPAPGQPAPPTRTARIPSEPIPAPTPAPTPTPTPTPTPPAAATPPPPPPPPPLPREEPEPEPAPAAAEPPAPAIAPEPEPEPAPPPAPPPAEASALAVEPEEPAPGASPNEAVAAPQPSIAEIFADLAEDDTLDEQPGVTVAAPTEPEAAPPPETAPPEPAPPPPPPAPSPPATPQVAARMTQAQPVGPQLVAEPPVKLETRIASAFDLAQQEAAEIARGASAPPSASATPPPTREERMEQAAEGLGLAIAPRMPAPGEAVPRPTAVGEGPWRDFTQWALDRLSESPAGGTREGMLLLDPPAIDPALKPCGNLPPAVLIDLDPANGLLPLVATERPHAALAADLAQLRRRGVTIYWISGHGPEAASAIRRRLAASGLDPDGVDPLIVTRFAGESKQARRYGLGETNCLLAIAGDHRADFDELYDFVLDPIMAAPLEGHVGHGWFIAPPPLD